MILGTMLTKPQIGKQIKNKRGMTVSARDKQ